METLFKAIFYLALLKRTTISRSLLIAGCCDMKGAAAGEIPWRRLAYDLDLAALSKQEDDGGDAHWFAIDALIIVRFSST